MRYLLALYLLSISEISFGAVLASDSFTRADSTGLGGNWGQANNALNQFDISGNKAIPHNFSSGDSDSYYSAITWPNDQYSKVKVTVNGTSGGGSGLGPGVRIAGPSGGHSLFCVVTDHAASGNTHLIKRVTGSFVDLGNATQSFTDGDYFEIQAIGTTLNVVYGGSTIISTTDSANSSGYAGIYFSTSETSASGDDWEGGDFTSAGGEVPFRRQLVVTE